MVRAMDHEDHTEAAGAEGSAPFDGYLEPDRPHAAAFDEMFHADGRVRSAYRALHNAIAPTAATDLAVRSEALDRAYLDQGITFSLSGQERPFPLDIVPRVIAAAEWSKLKRGIVQRVRALEAFLADIYRVAHRAAQRRRGGHVPAHLPRRAGRRAGGAVPAHGPALPLGVPRAAPGRAVPHRAGQPAGRALPMPRRTPSGDFAPRRRGAKWCEGVRGRVGLTRRRSLGAARAGTSR